MLLPFQSTIQLPLISVGMVNTAQYQKTYSSVSTGIMYLIPYRKCPLFLKLHLPEQPSLPISHMTGYPTGADETEHLLPVPGMHPLADCLAAATQNEQGLSPDCLSLKTGLLWACLFYSASLLRKYLRKHLKNQGTWLVEKGLLLLLGLTEAGQNIQHHLGELREEDRHKTCSHKPHFLSKPG